MDSIVFIRYADYVDVEYGDLDSDFMFVNLWRGQRGAAMTDAVADLAERLRRSTPTATELQLEPEVYERD